MLVVFVIIGQASAQTSDIVGKITVGYQGWFATPFDGSPRKTWVHWTISGGPSGTNPPSPGNCHFEIYPDMREYTQRYQTGMASLGNGQPANLFSSWDQSTVNLHFSWMQTNGIDTISFQVCNEIDGLQKHTVIQRENLITFQRFGSDLVFPLARQQMNGVAGNVQRAAELHNLKVFIQYDLSNWANFATELIPDLVTNMTILTASPAYATHNGRRVICLWGLGFGEPGGNRPNNPTGALNVISQLKSMGYDVMCGVPNTWRTNDGISRPTYAPVYRSCNMIQPWSVGTFGDTQTALAYRAREQADLQLCNSLNMVYQPVVWPGFAWSNWNNPSIKNQVPRANGTFMWRQFMNLKDLGITSPFIAMFDEFDEGTAIAKAAENSGMIPTNQYFLTMNADGADLSSDFYLRLVADAKKLLKGEITTSPNAPYTPPTPHRLPSDNPTSTTSNNPANNPSSNTQNNFSQFTNMMSNMTPSGLMSMLSNILSSMGL